MPYLTRILAENVRRYQQLKQMIAYSKSHEDYLRLVNRGLENSMGLLRVLPLKDQRLLKELGNAHQISRSVTHLYGSIPKSKEALIHKLHDRSVSQSIRMAGQVHDYARRQETNARLLSVQGRRASPKGAARMNVETNAKILHTLNQLLKVNGQMLKLQGEQLAMMNKNGKDSIKSSQRIRTDMKKSLKGLSGNFNLPKF